jgi:hypothetical protein
MQRPGLGAMLDGASPIGATRALASVVRRHLLCAQGADPFEAFSVSREGKGRVSGMGSMPYCARTFARVSASCSCLSFCASSTDMVEGRGNRERAFD